MSTTGNSISAYTIMITDDNTMVTTHKKRIVQRSKLVDDLWFLVHPEYNEHNMENFTVSLEYVLPVSRKYRNEILVLSSERHNGYLKYSLPFDTKLTAEAGTIELIITFLQVRIDENGDSYQHVRKATGGEITIHPINAWSDIIPDESLSALDQRIIKIDSQIKALNEASNNLHDNKADNISYDRNTNELQLMANGNPIGDRVVLKSGETDPDGTVVVDFSNYTGDYDDEEESDNNSADVILF